MYAVPDPCRDQGSSFLGRTEQAKRRRAGRGLWRRRRRRHRHRRPA
uniref:Uncharacterized protein n=1 Tax=Arundo donax TaxID=35708 RepID=A0A0A9BXT6_ARUDO